MAMLQGELIETRFGIDCMAMLELLDSAPASVGYYSEEGGIDRARAKRALDYLTRRGLARSILSKAFGILYAKPE
jgi:hypothetical protein